MNYIQVCQFLVTLVLLEIPENVSANEENDYRFLVKLETKGKLVCAGTIITPCVVLTSAHCVEGGKPQDITVTSTSNVKYEIDAVTVHPHYESTTLCHDLALVQTKKNFQKPWAGLYISSQITMDCNCCQMVTLGDHIMGNETAINPIKKDVHLIPNKECAILIKTLRGTFQGEGKVCGLTIDDDDEEGTGCFVNPGGPLMCYDSLQSSTKSAKTKGSRNVNYWKKSETLADPIDLLENLKKVKRKTQPSKAVFLAGVVSWGKGCSKVPSVYVKTAFYRDWITKTAKHMSRKCEANPEDFRFLTELKSKAGRVLFSNTSKFMVFFYVYYISPLVL